MSNHQADDLFVETLSRPDPNRVIVSFKPISIKSKDIKKIHEGMLIDGFDPYNLRLLRSGKTIARAKIGRIGDREVLYIVSSEPEKPEYKLGQRERLLEGRFTFLAGKEYEKGTVIELDEPLSDKILILVDKKPIAIGRMVEYNDEVLINITKVFYE